jgi:anti-sigma-K factor RskA
VHGVIDLRDDDERAAAAGEYVLGTLDADDRAAVERALVQDAGLRALVYAWQDRLLGLSARAASAEPRPPLWRRIDASLNALPAAAAAPVRAAPQGAAPWWQRLGLWQGASALALAASLVLGVLLVQRMTAPPADGARYLAALQSPDGQATGWVVELQAGAKLRLVPVAEGGPVPAGRSLQFWTKAEGAAGPTSLGLVRAGQTLELPASQLPAVGVRQLFEITLEPEAGSPIGRPTGPILFVGRTVAL